MNNLARVSVVLALALGSAALAQTDAPSAPAPAPTASTETITFKPDLAKGKVYRFNYHLERSEKYPSMGVNPGSDTTFDAEMTFTVLDATDAGATIELAVGAIKAQTKLPAGEFKFDSTQPEDDKDKENPAFLGFKPVVGMKLTLATDAGGLITSVSGDPVVPQGSLKELVAQAFTNPDYIKFRWNSVFTARRGNAPTRIGESWPHVDNFMAPPVGRFETTINHTLKSLKDKVATIDSVGEMKIFPTREGAPLAFELTGTSILSTAQWDTTDSVARGLEMQRSFTLDGKAQGLPVKREITEKLLITRLQ
jgi:hypothetical protein